MQQRILFVLCCLACTVFFSACSYVRVAELTESLKEKRQDALVAEQKIYAPFTATRTFHNGLKAVLVSPEKEPYPTLDSLFQHLFSITNAVVTKRLEADTLADEWLVEASRRKRLKSSSKLINQHQELMQMYSTVMEQDGALESDYVKCEAAYELLKRENGIARATHFEILEKASRTLYRFQDSLELQAAELASCKRHLKGTGLKLGQPEYNQHYSILSEAELLAKQYQNRLLQLENAYARFESGNSEEVYYEGPFLLPRMDVTVFNELVAQLTIEMERFRLLKADYFNSFAKEE